MTLPASTKGAGRRRYQRSARGRRRGGAPKQRKVASVEYGRQRFRFTCRRVRGPVQLAPLNIDPLVSEATWRRAGAVMTGEVTVNFPALRKLPGLITRGDVVRCEVSARDGAPWRPLWEMSVTNAQPSLGQGRAELRLRSRLHPAQRSRARWRFVKNEAHPRGWTADEITAAACRRFHVKMGKVARGQHRTAKLTDKSASVVEIVTAAWRQEREWTGRRFDVSIARGVLEVREVRRPRYMLLLGPSLVDALLDESLPAGFASAVVVTSVAKTPGSKKRRKVRAKVVDRARVRRYGYIVRHIERDGLDTAAEARKFGRRWLARTAKPFNRLTLTHAGIPWVDRGDALRVSLPEAGLSAVVFVVGVEHRLAGGTYEMDVVVGVQDPWERDEREARVRRRKAAARRRRQRPGRTAAERPKPKRARARS